MQYKRIIKKGATFFLTVVTYNRNTFLCIPENVSLLREAFIRVKEYHPFDIDAFVLLPDHFHCIWTLPEGESDYSTRMRLVKTYFTRHINKLFCVKVSL